MVARKIARQMSQRKERAEERQRAPVPTNIVGYDLRKVEMTDIAGMALDTNEETLTVSLLLPIGDYEGYAEYDEIIEMDDESLPDYLKHAAKLFAQAVLRSVKERQMVRGEVPCATCIGGCCMLDHIRLTDQDIARMEEAGISVGEDIISYNEAEDWTGHAGEFILTEFPPGADPDDEDTRLACPHLREDGCSIYENRPTVCREYSAWGCEAYEPDQAKIDGKVHLRVAQPS